MSEAIAVSPLAAFPTEMMRDFRYAALVPQVPVPIFPVRTLKVSGEETTGGDRSTDCHRGRSDVNPSSKSTTGTSYARDSLPVDLTVSIFGRQRDSVVIAAGISIVWLLAKCWMSLFRTSFVGTEWCRG